MIIILHRRLFTVIPTLLCLSLCVFLLLELAPGDAVDVMLDPAASAEAQDAIRAEYGLDLSLGQRYFRYLGQLLQGNMGTSVWTGGPVIDEIMVRLPYTLVLAGTALTLSLIIGVTLGAISAFHQHSIWDRLIRALVSVGVAIPVFGLALALVSIFSLQLGWLPVFGADSARHLILPAVCAAFPLVPGLTRLTRASLLEVRGEDFILMARGKGLPLWLVRLRHIAPVAAIPVVTYAGLLAVHLIGSLVVVETIFNWPGLGGLAVQAAFDRDALMLQGVTLVIAALSFAVLFGMDLLVLVLDPRISARSV